MTEFSPHGVTEPVAAADNALVLLKDRFNIDFTIPYRDGADHRHELASVAVHLGRRFLDVAETLKGSCDRDVVTLARLTLRAGDRDDFHTDRPEEWPSPLDGVVAQARLAELDRTLRVVAAAYKQAWWAGWSDPAPAGAEPAGS